MTPTPDDSIYSGMAITDSGAPGGGLTDTMKWHHDPRPRCPGMAILMRQPPLLRHGRRLRNEGMHDALSSLRIERSISASGTNCTIMSNETLWNLPFVALDLHIYWQPWVKGFMGDMGFGASYYANYFMWMMPMRRSDSADEMRTE